MTVNVEAARRRLQERDLFQRISEQLEEFNQDKESLAYEDEDPPVTYEVHLDEDQFAGLISVFRSKRELWSEFQQFGDPSALHPAFYRAFLHESIAYDMLKECLEAAECLHPQELSPELRRLRGERMVEFKQLLVGFGEKCPFHALAQHINEELDLPIMDGMLLRTLFFALSKDADLWRDFCRVVENGSNHD